MGIMPSLLTKPTVGFTPTTPFIEAGQTIEPFVSVPIEAGAIPSATIAALPELEPQGLCLRLYGLYVCPPTLDQPLVELLDLKLAHSERFVLPAITKPAFLRFLII